VSARAAVGFDLGDTLCEYAGVPLSWEREYPAALASVAEACRCELTPQRRETGIRVLSRYNTRLTAREDEREYEAEQIFGELLGLWGAAPEGVAEAIPAFFRHFRRTLRSFPESIDVLNRLRGLGVPTGVLTDVPYGMPRSLVVADLSQTGLAVPDGRLVTSTMVGRRKPHPAGFSALALALGASCAEMIYVGNERKDIDGGNVAGCQTVLVWRVEDDVPAWGQAATIRSLEEVPRFLRG
jgi:putative hydrolase of the HAD superfamily